MIFMIQSSKKIDEESTQIWIINSRNQFSNWAKIIEIREIARLIFCYSVYLI